MCVLPPPLAAASFAASRLSESAFRGFSSHKLGLSSEQEKSRRIARIFCRLLSAIRHPPQGVSQAGLPTNVVLQLSPSYGLLHSNLEARHTELKLVRMKEVCGGFSFIGLTTCWYRAANFHLKPSSQRANAVEIDRERKMKR